MLDRERISRLNEDATLAARRRRYFVRALRAGARLASELLL
jgi:hypothetical protein